MPACTAEDGSPTMENCYTTWKAKWGGYYEHEKTVEYARKIFLAYTNWSLAHRQYWFSYIHLTYDDKSHKWKLSIAGINLEREDMDSFKDTFGQFEDYQKELSSKTSSAFWRTSDNDNLAGRDPHNIWYMINGTVAVDDSPGCLIDTILNYWQPHCEEFPHLPCLKEHYFVDYVPIYDSTTGKAVYDSGGPISKEFRRA